MARKARVKSSTGIYHVLVRAVSDLSLVSDMEDAQFYIDILNDLQQKGYCEVHAYALFPTHAHLLIKEGEGEPIGSIMKRIAGSYSYYFNVKYEHYGPIYIDRFKSNPVETKDYFLRVLNHIGSQQAQYKYTCRHIPSGLQTSSETPSPVLLDYRIREKRITDIRLQEYLSTQFHFTNIGEFLQRDLEEQNQVISSCKKIGGSIRQIMRLTGCPFARVFSVRG